MSDSPTSRSLKYMRGLGYTCQVVEKFNPWSRKSRDLFGFIDIVAMKPGEGIIGIQATSTGNVPTRIRKAEALPGLQEWLDSGGKVEFQGWAKRGKAGKRKLWTIKRIIYPLTQVNN